MNCDIFAGFVNYQKNLIEYHTNQWYKYWRICEWKTNYLRNTRTCTGFKRPSRCKKEKLISKIFLRLSKTHGIRLNCDRLSCLVLDTQRTPKVIPNKVVVFNNGIIVRNISVNVVTTSTSNRYNTIKPSFKPFKLFPQF